MCLTHESVWTCACPRLVESSIGTVLEQNALTFGLKPALRSDYILYALLPCSLRAPLRSHALVIYLLSFTLKTNVFHYCENMI